MALPAAVPATAAVVSKGIAVVKGAKAAQLAKAGVTVVSSAALAKGMSKKEKTAIKKESKRKGICVDFDFQINNKFRIHNKRYDSKNRKKFNSKYKNTGGKR